jgi:hypothetical protein
MDAQVLAESSKTFFASAALKTAKPVPPFQPSSAPKKT